MQALNLQIVNPQQEQEVSSKKVSSVKIKSDGSSSFRKMVEDACRPQSSAKDSEVSNTKEKKDSKDFSDDIKSSEIPEKETSPDVFSSPVSFFTALPESESSFVLQDTFDKDFSFVGIENLKPTDSNVENDSEPLNFPISELTSPDVFLDDSVKKTSFLLDESKNDDLDLEQKITSDDPEKLIALSLKAEESGFNTHVELADIPVSGETSSKESSSGFSSFEKKDNFFKLEVSGDEKKTSKEAPSLFENIFTVTDERSIEQKIIDLKSEVKSGEEKRDNNLNLTLSLSENANQNILSTDNQSAGSSGSVFQQMLTQQIQTSVPDFVKAGSIVLRDNDSGTINMVLKPENLGNVKINLHLSDNVITGQITVNSKEAFEAFKQNLETLKQAFQDSGFDGANLSLGYANTSSGSFAQGEREQSSEQFFSNQVYGDYASSAEISESEEVSAFSVDSDRQFSVIV